MKRRYLLILSLILIVLGTSCVSAGLFDNIDCEEFSIEIPDGLERPKGGYQGDPEHSIRLWSGLVKDGELFRTFKISTLPLGDLPENMSVVEDYNEGDLKVMKGTAIDDEYGGNDTYAEFDKDGKHFYLVVEYDCDLEKINLTGDVEMIKTLKNSVKVK